MSQQQAALQKKNARPKTTQPPRQSRAKRQAPEHPHLQAQETSGSHGLLGRLGGIIQRKPTVGSRSDKNGQEADGLVEQAMRTSEPNHLQRKCACGRSVEVSGECAECRRKRLSGLTPPLLQARLTINQPGDRYEQEADRVADTVMRIRKPGMQRQVAALGQDGQRLQTKPTVQRPVVGHGKAPPVVREVLRSPGRPLDPTTRAFMEPRFGHDFSGVRIHTGARAAATARAVNAQAYTVGRNIVFGASHYAPNTAAGNRLIAHELTHVVQQSAVPAGGSSQRSGPRITPGTAGLVQRKVEPEGISSAGKVLNTIKATGESYFSGATSGESLADLVAEKGSAVASKAVANNLARLVALSKKFNPGVPGQAGPTNAFVYTCRCGWIDMGHFFISASGAFAAAYAQQLALRVEGEPYTQGKLLVLWLDYLSPWLEPLLDTVAPGGRGKEILAQQRKLFESGEPRDVSLGFGGYLTEYYQQLGKLFADPMKTVPKWLKGEQESAFTTEDLPSDCYGAAVGQDLWKQVGHLKEGADISPLHDLMTGFFKECKAVFPKENSRIRCEMMGETTPGSCRVEGNEPIWSEEGGTPRQHTSEKPFLLESAEPLCGKNPPIVPCRTATGSIGTPLEQDLAAKAVLDLTFKDLRAKLSLFENIILPQPQARGRFGGEVDIPGRPELIDPREPLRLRGPSILQIDKEGNLIGYSTLQGVPGLGDTRLLAQLSLRTGQLSAHASGPVVEVEASGKAHLDYVGLLQEMVELTSLTSPEIARFREIYQSSEFRALVQKFVRGESGPEQLYNEVKALLESRFPAGLKKIPLNLLKQFIGKLDKRVLAIYIGFEGKGTVKVLGLPLGVFDLHKGTGRTSPLLALEAGLIGSEFFSKRATAGAKISVYGEKFFQGHAISGVDLLNQKLFTEIYGETEQLTGMELNLRLRYEMEPRSGEKLFMLTVGGEFEKWGSK